MDAQVVATLNGAVDYVAKYISKYGAGQSVTARIGSLIDDIITRLPEGKKTTVCSVLSKAFMSTSVPDSLCGLEAWHLLFDLGRVICSRGFVSLQAEASKAQRQVAVPTSRKESAHHEDAMTNYVDTQEVARGTLLRTIQWLPSRQRSRDRVAHKLHYGSVCW